MKIISSISLILKHILKKNKIKGFSSVNMSHIDGDDNTSLQFNNSKSNAQSKSSSIV